MSVSLVYQRFCHTRWAHTLLWGPLSHSVFTAQAVASPLKMPLFGLLGVQAQKTSQTKKFGVETFFGERDFSPNVFVGYLRKLVMGFQVCIPEKRSTLDSFRYWGIHWVTKKSLCCDIYSNFCDRHRPFMNKIFRLLNTWRSVPR